MSPSDLPKLWTEPKKIGHILITKIFKTIFVKRWSPSPIFFNWKDTINFEHWKMTLKIRTLRCSRRLFSNFNFNCSNLLDLKNLQEQVKIAFCHQKFFWPFTVWINCSIDLKKFKILGLQPWISKVFLDH